MKEIKREVTTEQTVYEVTKEELEKIKHDARIEGRYDILKYFCFALQNYRYELNTLKLPKCNFFKFTHPENIFFALIVA